MKEEQCRAKRDVYEEYKAEISTRLCFVLYNINK